MWRCSDGFNMTVTYTPAISSELTAYLTHTNDADLQTLTLNDYTYITNRTKRTEMDTSTKAPAKPFEAYVELKKVAYASQYSLNLYDSTAAGSEKIIHTATRIRVDREYDTSNNCAANGNPLTQGQLPTGGNRCTTGDTLSLIHI